MAQSH